MSTKFGPNVWVVRHGSGFAVTEEGTGAYRIPSTDQRTAIIVARWIALANRSELIVQGRSGRIRFRKSYSAYSRRMGS